MSPEQAAVGRTEGWRSDFYSLGLVLFEMLTGKPPFHGSARETMKQRQLTAPPDVRTLRPDIPEEIAGIVRRTLAGDPSMRYPTGGALVRAVDAALEQLDLSDNGSPPRPGAF
jgi:serine/threonine-protein kinase